MKAILKVGIVILVIVGNGFDLACGFKNRGSPILLKHPRKMMISVSRIMHGGSLILILKILTGKTYMSSNWADVEQLISDFLKEEHGFSDKQRAGAQRLSFSCRI